MAVPDFQSLMLPVLSACSQDDTDKTTIRDRVATKLFLSDADLQERLPSGRTTTFANRVAWAITYLQIAGLLDRVQRGVYRITPEGKKVIESPPPRIDMKYLERYPRYVEWRHGSTSKGNDTSAADSQVQAADATPEELIEASYQAMLAAIELELLDRLRNVHYSYFESVIIDLLIAMGYGGGKAEMGKAIGRSGDGGIDGIIREDPLGLDIVYVQAKRNAVDNSVGRPDIQNFAGSLDGVGATKGVFFTTSSFTAGAREFAQRIAKRIVLIDGNEIARLMVENNVGIRLGASYVIKRIDEEYFGADGSAVEA